MNVRPDSSETRTKMIRICVSVSGEELSLADRNVDVSTAIVHTHTAVVGSEDDVSWFSRSFFLLVLVGGENMPVIRIMRTPWNCCVHVPSSST